MFCLFCIQWVKSLLKIHVAPFMWKSLSDFQTQFRGITRQLRRCLRPWLGPETSFVILTKSLRVHLSACRQDSCIPGLSLHSKERTVHQSEVIIYTLDSCPRWWRLYCLCSSVWCSCFMVLFPECQRLAWKPPYFGGDSPLRVTSQVLEPFLNAFFVYVCLIIFGLW